MSSVEDAVEGKGQEMKVIRKRLTKKEVEQSLRCSFERILRVRFSGVELKHRVEMMVKNCYQKWHLLESARTVKRVYQAAKKKRATEAKKSKVVFSKSAGPSRKKCPKCNNRRMRVWPGLMGKKHLLCVMCGWSSRTVARG